MTITPLDTCGLVRLTGENYRKVAAAPTLARAVIENYEIWRRAGDPKAKEPAGQLGALRHRGDLSGHGQ